MFFEPRVVPRSVRHRAALDLAQRWRPGDASPAQQVREASREIFLCVLPLAAGAKPVPALRCIR